MPSFRVPVHARGERETVGYTSVSRGPDRSRFPLSTPRKLRVEKEGSEGWGFRKHVARAVSSPYPRSRAIDRSPRSRPIKSWPGTVSKFYGAVRPFRDKLLFDRVSTRLVCCRVRFSNVSNTRSKQFTDVNHDPRADAKICRAEARRFSINHVLLGRKVPFFLWKRKILFKFEYRKSRFWGKNS